MYQPGSRGILTEFCPCTNTCIHMSTMQINRVNPALVVARLEVKEITLHLFLHPYIFTPHSNMFQQRKNQLLHQIESYQQANICKRTPEASAFRRRPKISINLAAPITISKKSKNLTTSSIYGRYRRESANLNRQKDC